MSRWRWARLLGGVAVLAVLVAQLGAGPFVAGLGRLGPTTIAVACGVTLATTLCSAWRWSTVARALGVDVPLAAAVGACYRSQLLNLTLPGGVVGDVHRGVLHGRETGRLAPALRSVAWERALGQVVQVVLTVALLAVLPSPWRSTMLAVVPALLVGGCLLLLAVGRRVRRGPGRCGVLAGDAFRLAASPRAVAGIALASGLAVSGHVVLLLVAARSAGVTAAPQVLVPVALLVLLASAVPLNVAGWGPREGMAAWAFGAAGLGGAEGLTTAVVFGLLTVLGTVPGAVPLLRASSRGRAATAVAAGPARLPDPDVAHG